MSYDSTILAEGSLVAYWRLGDAAGSAADSKGTNTGTYTGSPSLATSLITGGDQCHDFNGSSQYVGITGTSTLQPASITVEAWINVDTFVNDKRIVTIADDCFALEVDAAGHLLVKFWNGSLYRTSTSAAAMSTGTTYYVAGSWDDSTKELTGYINASVDGQQTQASQAIVWTGAVFTSAVASGSGGLSANDLDARIDEVAVYSTALAGASLSAHYIAGTVAAATPSLYLTQSNLRLG